MTCREFERRLGDLFEERLAPGKRRKTRAHMLRCCGCALSRRRYEETIALARAAYDREELPPAPEEMVRSILAAVRPRASSAIRGLVHLISGIAASQLIVFYLGR
jgi:hypothetical protein